MTREGRLRNERKRSSPIANFLMAMLLLAASATLKVGDHAPDFALPDYNGKIVKLADFRGKKSVILAFYIRASTPG